MADRVVRAQEIGLACQVVAQWRARAQGVDIGQSLHDGRADGVAQRGAALGLLSAAVVCGALQAHDVGRGGCVDGGVDRSFGASGSSRTQAAR